MPSNFFRRTTDPNLFNNFGRRGSTSNTGFSPFGGDFLSQFSSLGFPNFQSLSGAQAGFQAPGPPDVPTPGFDPDNPFNPDPGTPPGPTSPDEPLGNFAQFVQALRGLERGPVNDATGGLQGLIDLINEFSFTDNIFGGRVSERVLRHARRLAPDRFGDVSDTIALDRLARLLGLDATGQGPLFNPDGTPRSGGGSAGAGGDTGGGDGLGGGDDDALGGAQGGVLGQLEQVIMQLLRGPFGLPARQLQQATQSINTRAAQREQQALGNLSAQFNTRGQLGGGQLGRFGSEISQGISEGALAEIQDLQLQNAFFANDARQQAIGAALGFGQLGLQGELGRGSLNLNNQQFLAGLAQNEQMLNLMRILFGQVG